VVAVLREGHLILVLDQADVQQAQQRFWVCRPCRLRRLLLLLLLLLLQPSMLLPRLLVPSQPSLLLPLLLLLLMTLLL